MDKEKKTKASEILKELTNKSFDIRLLKNQGYRASLERAIETLTEENAIYESVPFKTKGEVRLDLRYGDYSCSYYDYWYNFEIDKTGKSSIKTEEFETFVLFLTKEIEEFFLELGVLHVKDNYQLDKERAMKLLRVEQDFLNQQKGCLRNNKENFINMYKRKQYEE